MQFVPAMIASHAILTTLGFGGLIATNAWLLLLVRDGDPAAASAGIRTWRRAMRLFGPALGLGILAGFALALTMGMPLGAAWLVATYALIVLLMGAQASVMVPWQLRADAAIARGEGLSTRAIVIVLTVAYVAYAGILSLMLLRP